MKNNRIYTFIVVFILLCVCNQMFGNEQNLYNGGLFFLGTTDSTNKESLDSKDEHLLFLGIPMTDYNSFSASLVEKGFQCTKPKSKAKVYKGLYDCTYRGLYLNRNAIVNLLIGKEDDMVGEIFVFIPYENIQMANEDMNTLIRQIISEYSQFSIEESEDDGIYYITINSKNDDMVIGNISLEVKDLDGYGCISVSLSDCINSHIQIDPVSETLDIID